MRGKLASAGLTVHAGTLAYNDSFFDDEIEATFRQAKALGVTTISSALTLAMARRVVPFAQRHRVSVAIHKPRRRRDDVVALNGKRQTANG